MWIINFCMIYFRHQKIHYDNCCVQGKSKG